MTLSYRVDALNMGNFGAKECDSPYETVDIVEKEDLKSQVSAISEKVLAAGNKLFNGKFVLTVKYNGKTSTLPFNTKTDMYKTDFPGGFLGECIYDDIKS